MIGNEIVDAEIKKVAESLQHGFNYFLNCLNKDGGSIEAAPGSLAEYVSYIAIRSDNTINSIVNLNGINEAGSIYALGRSLFESYVYLRAINCDASFFEVNVLPSLSFSECGIQIEDGAIKYKRSRRIIYLVKMSPSEIVAMSQSLESHAISTEQMSIRS